MGPSLSPTRAWPSIADFRELRLNILKSAPWPWLDKNWSILFWFSEALDLRLEAHTRFLKAHPIALKKENGNVIFETHRIKKLFFKGRHNILLSGNRRLLAACLHSAND